MNDIDEMVRAFRADLPEPQMPPPAETARRAVAEFGRSRHTRRARRAGRALVVGGGAVGAAALATVLAVLLVNSPGRDTSGLPTRGFGIQTIVDVIPDDPSTDPAALRARIVKTLETRATTAGIDGFTATVRDDGSISMIVPGAGNPAQIDSLLAHSNPLVVDLTRDVLAASVSADDLVPTLQARLTPASPATRWVQLYNPPGVKRSLVGAVAPTRAELTRQAVDPHRIVGLPAGLTIAFVQDALRIDRTFPPEHAPEQFGTHYLVPDAPIMTSDDISSAEQRGRSVLVRLTPAARGGVAQARARAARGTGPGLVLSIDVVGPHGIPTAAAVLSDTPTDDGTVAFEASSVGGARRLAELLAAGGLPATLAHPRTRRYGTRPPLTGEPAVDFPLRTPTRFPDSGAPGDADLQDIVKVLEATTADGSLPVYAARTARGSDGYWAFPTPKPGAKPSEGFSPPGGACDWAPGVPPLSVCFAHFGSAGGFGLVIGRATPDVARVEGRVAGAEVLAGTVGNGWFALIVPRSVTRPDALEALDAFDDRGRRIQSIDSPLAQPVVLP